MRHISSMNTNHPFHPIYWSCDTTSVEKIEPPHQLCPLHGAGTPEEPSGKPPPKLDPAVEKMIDGMDVNINALLRSQRG